MAVGYGLGKWIESSETAGFRVSSIDTTNLYLNFIG
jgi:hypothetical protein